MKFDALGLPQVNGSTDLQDSAALAGIMTVFRWPRLINLSKYILQDPKSPLVKFDYVRHPLELVYDFSRDQTIALTSGFSVQAPHLVDEKFITGKDILSPSVKGHIRRCRGETANFLQDAWFWADLWFSAKFKPLDELNQLFCMMQVADKKFMRWYCNANPQWRKALREYWFTGPGAWRNEEDLCEWMIARIDEQLD